MTYVAATGREVAEGRVSRAGEGEDRAKGSVDVGRGGAEGGEARVERRGEELEGGAVVAGERVEDPIPDRRLHPSRPRLAALQRQHAGEHAVGAPLKEPLAARRGGVAAPQQRSQLLEVRPLAHHALATAREGDGAARAGAAQPHLRRGLLRAGRGASARQAPRERLGPLLECCRRRERRLLAHAGANQLPAQRRRRLSCRRVRNHGSALLRNARSGRPQPLLKVRMQLAATERGTLAVE